MKNLKFAMFIAAMCMVGGLAVAKDKSINYGPVDKPAAAGNYEGAAAAVLKAGNTKKSKLYPLDDKVNYFLDLGTLTHYSKKYDDSFTSLDEAEKAADEIKTLDSTKKDNSEKNVNPALKPYTGESFEILYSDLFNALNNYNRGGDDNIQNARIEATQAMIKFNTLQDLAAREAAQVEADAKNDKNLKDIEFPPVTSVKFNNSALVSYVALLLERDNNNGNQIPYLKGQIDKAFTDSKSVYYNPKPKSLDDELKVPAGKARINVLGFTGLSPIKVQEKEVKELKGMKFLTVLLAMLQTPQNVSDVITTFTATIPYPTIAATAELANGEKKDTKDLTKDDKVVKTIPTPRSAVITKVQAEVNGQVFELELLEDVGKVIYDSFAIKKDVLYRKAYARAMAKTISAITGFSTASIASPDMVMMLAGPVKKSLADGEKTDIRMARYMPNSAFVGGINVDPGTYDVKITYFDKDGKEVGSETRSIEAKTNKPNIIEAVNLK
ncbi:MAG: hypothetical protein Ta2F_06850 [Termitinemataceae bacterium]|nr:MAG: hypothetical protein Ta2F_06850 [Termitinemataceae bacterium]